MHVFVLLVLVGVALIVGPFTLPAMLDTPPLSSISQIVLVGFGAIVLMCSTLALMISRFFRKPSASQAFVRTGWGSAKVILDYGAFVIPVVHRLVEVSLETMRLDVKRTGPEALITRDNLRVDIASEFYIRVDANEHAILQAARSLGEKSVNARAVSELVYEKLVSALRSVAATKELLELHVKRDEFASAVLDNLSSDLVQNGLKLETVTISQLDQTPPESLNEQNVFDAQGLRKITEITQTQNVERNRINRDAERQIKEKDVGVRKEVLELERDQAEAEAGQATEIANIRAAKLREQQEYEIQQRREVELAAVAKDEAVKKANILKTQTIELTDVARERQVKTQAVQRDQAVQEAEVLRQQAVDVAQRVAEIAIAEKEAARAAAETKAKAAEAQREAEAQRVQTVAVTAEADREAQKKMIEEKQQVDIGKYRLQIDADVAAYSDVKKAEGELQAAQKQREARLVLAEADAIAAKRRSEGDEAIKMVDVKVDREKVAVEQARVDVERQELENRQTFSEAALKFEVQKLEINASAEVQKAFAAAIGDMLSKANMQIFGDPSTLANMTNQFMSSAGYAQRLNGFRTALPEDIQQLAGRALSGVGSSLAAGLRKITGQDIDPATIEKVLTEVVAQQTAPDNGPDAPAIPKDGSKKS
jgi:flotillin